MAPRKFLIDTDTGVDDAMALFMSLDAHKRNEIQILGITAVDGNGPLKNVLVNIYRVLDTVDCADVSS